MNTIIVVLVVLIAVIAIGGAGWAIYGLEKDRGKREPDEHEGGLPL
jgi:hypothetical protein